MRLDPAVSFYDWMLALHLLAAFSIAAALVLYSVLVVAGRRWRLSSRRACSSGSRRWVGR